MAMAYGHYLIYFLNFYFSPGQLDPVSSQAQTDAIVKSVSISLNPQEKFNEKKYLCQSQSMRIFCSCENFIYNSLN